jgi:hypothetical protein
MYTQKHVKKHLGGRSDEDLKSIFLRRKSFKDPATPTFSVLSVPQRGF